MGVSEDRNIITIMPCSNYYWGGYLTVSPKPNKLGPGHHASQTGLRSSSAKKTLIGPAIGEVSDVESI